MLEGWGFGGGERDAEGLACFFGACGVGAEGEVLPEVCYAEDCLGALA